MYLAHFGLRELPFGITPDTAFTFSGRSHQEALNTLLVALQGGEGFVKITGEVGTGKTLLCRRLLASLGRKYVTAYVPNPALRPRTLLLALADELDERLDPGADQHQLVKRLNDILLQFAAAGRRVVVCLDEAQALPLESLEALRLLSNLETEKRKLLQVVLFGQPELDAKLHDRSVRQLRQRIGFSHVLRGLDPGEVRRYLDHRLRVAGHGGDEVFTPAAARLVARATGGVPRLVNIVAHKALLAVYGQGGQVAGVRHAVAAVRDSVDLRAGGAGMTWWAGAVNALACAGLWRSGR
ncbi:MAG TPA: AAA family ATPase [Rhodocyclaceae bacterium]|nr:AAA family ATPase [Rhodocyclaceae bacterium]